MTVTIDGRSCENVEGETILDIARRNDIYIPTLCNHPDLSAFGGCRLCLVKVEGMRSYVPACATPVTDDMVIETTEEHLDVLRRRILELILSEHPSACIICADREECLDLHPDPTKAGRVTGCRFCPNRNECELFDVVKYLGVDDIWVETDYKDVPMFRKDPFIHRDYNLCILCGRCVRVCSEIRGVGAIAFTNRSHDATVGTAFQGPLVDSSCVFCGACEDVCPTGAISAKMTRWVSIPEVTGQSTCVMCPAGCSMDVGFKWGSMTYNAPSKDGENVAQACLKGRYCTIPLTNSKKRLEYPRVASEGGQRPVRWEAALEAAAEGLRRFAPEEIGMIVSPSLTVEEAFLAQRIMRGLGSDNIAIASNMAGPMQKAWGGSMDRVAGIGTMADIRDCDAVLIVGTDLSLTAAVSVVHVHAAHENGARVFDIKIDPKKTYRHAEVIEPSAYGEFMEMVLEELKTPGQQPHGPERDAAGDVASALKDAGKVAMMIGPGAFRDAAEGTRVAATALEIFEAVNGTVLLPLWDGGNVQGVLEAGASRCLTPGQCIEHDTGKYASGKNPLGEGIKALYLTHPVPEIPDGVEFVIYQGPFGSSVSERADVILPSSMFSETEGTVISLDGRVGALTSDARLPNMAQPDWKVFVDLGKALGLDGFGFDDVASVRDATGLDLTPGTHLPPGEPLPAAERAVRVDEAVNPVGPWPCSATRYRGHDITEEVEDFLEVVLSWGWDE